MINSSIRRVLLAVACVCVVIDVPAGPVNINSADAVTLARELKGVGLKRAQAIVDYRTKNGPFKSADELALVKGVGRRAIESNRSEIRIDAVKTTTKPTSGTPASAASAVKRTP